ncbi:MAG TPA: YceI family protein [Rickettsiales bacterium]|nr:YceI family protein [Rickettsiales bacterium]
MIKSLLLSALLLLPLTANAGGMPHWKVNAGKSWVQWATVSSGKPITGFFPTFSSDIVFDPAQLNKSSVRVEIKTEEVKTDDTDARENLPSRDWFASNQYPLAIFNCTQFQSLGGGRYLANGTLTLRDKSLPVQLPFSLKISGNTAVMDSDVVLKRLDFGVGQGSWADTNAIADAVKVKVHVEAELAAARGG